MFVCRIQCKYNIKIKQFVSNDILFLREEKVTVHVGLTSHLFIMFMLFGPRFKHDRLTITRLGTF